MYTIGALRGPALLERIRNVVSIGLLSAVVGCLAGCGSVPTSGPSTDAVIAQGSGSAQDYQLIDLDGPVVDILSRPTRDSFAGRFSDHRSSSEPLIGIG